MDKRLEHYFATNGVVKAERKLSIFLTVIGPSTYKLLQSLVLPHKLGEKTLEELTLSSTLTQLPLKFCDDTNAIVVTGSLLRQSQHSFHNCIH